MPSAETPSEEIVASEFVLLDPNAVHVYASKPVGVHAVLVRRMDGAYSLEMHLPGEGSDGYHVADAQTEDEGMRMLAELVSHLNSNECAIDIYPFEGRIEIKKSGAWRNK
ncbi:MAG: hypothetical protein QW548_00760 [Candidatus Aenigmatarchaeota archaeon]